MEIESNNNPPQAPTITGRRKRSSSSNRDGKRLKKQNNTNDNNSIPISLASFNAPAFNSAKYRQGFAAPNPPQAQLSEAMKRRMLNEGVQSAMRRKIAQNQRAFEEEQFEEMNRGGGYQDSPSVGNEYGDFRRRTPK